MTTKTNNPSGMATIFKNRKTILIGQAPAGSIIPGFEIVNDKALKID